MLLFEGRRGLVFEFFFLSFFFFLFFLFFFWDIVYGDEIGEEGEE